MTLAAKKIADCASFCAFINAYIREVDSGVWHRHSDWRNKTGLQFVEHEDFVLELQLNEVDTCLAIGCSFRSNVGRHQFTSIYQQQKNQWTWHNLESLSAILLLINNIFSGETRTAQFKSNPAVSSFHNNSNKMELISRVVESHQRMRDYISKRIGDPRLDQLSFIESEQSVVFGHWLHPTPKSRQGIHDWQQGYYSPELAAKFQLHFFAVDKQLVNQDAAGLYSSEEIINKIAHKDSRPHIEQQLTQHLTKGKQLLPVHPLQAQWLLHQDYLKALIEKEQVIDLGLLGAHFSPSSSVRTLYCEELEYMIKLSIPVKITNSLRVNMQHELSAGMLVGNYLDKTSFSKLQPQFKFIRDPAFITLNLAEKKESGFEVIFRENPFYSNKKKAENTFSIAALVQEPINPGSRSKLYTIIHSLAKKENKALSRVSARWYERYWHTAIEPAIKLYDSTGLAIEAHQQNSLLEISQGYPLNFYYRDNQGFYLSETFKSKIKEVEPALASKTELFYEDSMICNRFNYYLIVNQLFSVINRFALDGLISETALLALTYKKLMQLSPQLKGVGRYFVKALLEQKQIASKGNLLTRVEDLDELQEKNELAVYTQINNPFLTFAGNSEQTRLQAYLESA